MARPISQKSALLIRYVLLIGLGLTLAGNVALAQNQNAYDRGTPAESKGGQSSMSTYSQDKIETVNLANGNLNMHIPLVTIGGRGSAAYTVALTYNSKIWSANHEREPVTDQLGHTTFIEHYATTFDDGNLTKPNLIPLGSGWSICKGPAIKVRQVNINPLSCPGLSEGTRFRYALTKVWVVLPDGSEVEMRDDLTDGAPYSVPNPCNNDTVDRDRGKVWHSTDGSAITYIMNAVNGFNPLVNDYSGSVFLSDGTRLAMGSGGRCTKMIDRNGNVLDFVYDDTGFGSVTYTDHLGRQVRVQAVSVQDQIVGATVTITGYNGVADRTVSVNGGTIGAHLRSDLATSLTIYNSDVGLDGRHLDSNPHFDMFYDTNNSVGSDWYAGLTGISGENTITSLTLLDGRQFQFQYNRFGEVAEIVYPGGGVSQIEYAPQPGGSFLPEAGGGIALMLNRAVTSRKVMADGSDVDAVWSYTRTGPTVTVEGHQGSATGPLLMSEVHTFLALDAEYRVTSGTHGSDGTGYEKFENARESQVTRSTGPGSSETENRDWHQRADVNWGSEPFVTDQTAGDGQQQPPNDPRVLTEQHTLESGKIKKTEYTYDKFNNVLTTKEYDFSVGGVFTLLRETDHAYFVDLTLNGYCYDSLDGLTCGSSANTDSNAIIHMRRLLKSETVKNGANGVEAYTEYEYDNYAPDSNHAAVVVNSGMSEYNGNRFASFASQFQPRGNVTSVKRLISGPITGGVYTTSYSQYDNAGNVVKTIVPNVSNGVDITSTTTISYTDNFGDGANPTSGTFFPSFPTFAFPSTVTNSLGQAVKTQYDYARGVATGVKDPNGVIAKSDHNDPYDRITQVTAGYGLSGSNTSLAQFTYPTASSNTTTVTKQLDDTRWLTYRDSYDGFGRAVGAAESEDGSQSSTNFTITSTRTLDGLGRIRLASNPSRGSGATTNGWMRNTYDLEGRVTEVATFSGDTQPPDSGTNGNWTGSVVTTFNGEVSTVRDQANKQRRSTVDGLGRLASVDELFDYPSTSVYSTTSYGYDARGNLKSVSQSGQSRTFSYDGLSRLTDATNPENGHIGYTYDSASNLATKTDGRFTTTYGYDSLNRVLTRTYTGTPATPSVSYAYDTSTNGVGRLASVTTSGVSTYTYTTYDPMGRPTAYSQATNSQTYTMGATYNKAGMELTETYPSGRVITTAYDNKGRLNGITGQKSGEANKTYASSFSYTAHGAIGSMQLGNNLWEHTNFNSRLQPTEIGLGTASTGTSSTSTLGLDYTFGTSASTNNGNVQSQIITVGTSGTVINQSYTYDQVNRLQIATESVSGTQQWSQSYGYDVFGNRWVTGYVPNTTLTPIVSSQISATNNRLVMGFSHYDGSGNLDTDAAGSTFSYDGENRQVTANVNGQPATYSYDGDGHRVMKAVGPAGSAVTTVFVYDAMGKLIAEYQSDPVPPAPNGGGTSYLTTDHLGSTRVVTKANQSVQARYDYLPFGEELGSGISSRTIAMGYSAADSTKQKFTGKERDTESGLDYFLARYYSSAQGRFTSPDEFTGGPHDLFAFSDQASANPTFYADSSNPQSLNKYQYAYNNPLRYADRDGHDPGDEKEKGGGFLSGWISYEKGQVMGVVDTVVGTATGAVGLVTHPVDTIKETVKDIKDTLKADLDIVTHPKEAAKAVVGAIKEGGTDNALYILGHASGSVAATIVLAKGAKELGGMAKAGREFKIGNNFRIAPFGNRTGHPIGRFPHYHRRIVGPNGKTLPGGSMKWHRPWEKGR